MSLGIEGYLNRHLAFWERILLGAAGVLLIDPGLTTDMIGFIALGGFGLSEIVRKKRVLRNKESLRLKSLAQDKPSEGKYLR
jgi:TRAP-type uncharacterized transport system fused permease subunit